MVFSHVLLGIFWTLFGVIHSLLASPRVKQRTAAHWPSLYSRYRLLYNLVAVVSFTGILWYQLKLASPRLFLPLVWAGSVLAFTGLLLMGICIRKYFIQLSGLRSKTNGAQQLRIDGVHRFVRHPLYLGTFLFIWGLFLLIPNISLLISNSIITIYTLLGIRWEEQKLREEFGSAYEEYQQKVPMIMPHFRKLF